MSVEKHIRDIIGVKKSKMKPSAGKLLVSEPFMPNMYFKRTVILLIEHNEEGSIGVVLNKPTFLKIKDVVNSFPDVNHTVHSGGPVNINNIYFLHRLSDIISEGDKLVDDVYWGGNKEEIIDILQANYFEDDKMRIFMGYSGWTPGQLDFEIENYSWIVTDLNTDLIFNTPAKELWSAVVEDMGHEYSYWKNLPINPQMN